MNNLFNNNISDYLDSAGWSPIVIQYSVEAAVVMWWYVKEYNNPRQGVAWGNLSPADLLSFIFLATLLYLTRSIILQFKNMIIVFQMYFISPLSYYLSYPHLKILYDSQVWWRHNSLERYNNDKFIMFAGFLWNKLIVHVLLIKS